VDELSPLLLLLLLPVQAAALPTVNSDTGQPPFNSQWLRSYDADVNLTVSQNVGGDNVLRWDSPKHFSTIFTYLPESVSLDKGHKANFTFRWRSSGSNLCPASCFSNGEYCQSKTCHTKCVSKSVSCLGGTGDFRIALLDTSKANGTLSEDNWCPAGVGYGDMTKRLTEAPFDTMKGYDFRIFPHLTSKAKHEPGQVPCSIYRKTSPNLFGKSPRLGEWGCFGAPLGEWTTLSLVVERRDSDRFKLSMSMNGVTYSADDHVSPSDPSALSRVDAVAIGYPNGRGYTFVELAELAKN